MIIKKLKLLLGKLIPKIHILPQVIYINWFGYDWYIKKNQNRILLANTLLAQRSMDLEKY